MTSFLVCQVLILQALIGGARSICDVPTGIQDPVTGRDIWLYSAQDVVSGGRLHGKEAWSRPWPTAPEPSPEIPPSPPNVGESSLKPSATPDVNNKLVEPSASADVRDKQITPDTHTPDDDMTKSHLAPQTNESNDGGSAYEELDLLTHALTIPAETVTPNPESDTTESYPTTKPVKHASSKASKPRKHPKAKIPASGVPVTGTITLEDLINSESLEVEPPYIPLSITPSDAPSSKKPVKANRRRENKVKANRRKNKKLKRKKNRKRQRLLVSKLKKASTKNRVKRAATTNTPSFNTPIWLQADLNHDYVVTGIQTQGKSGSDDWVTSYRVDYSRDCENFLRVIDREGVVAIFPGNRDASSVVTNVLTQPVVARCVRILPTSVNGRAAAMRMEVLGCSVSDCKKD